jgi:methylated-DNA-[protein]-cysteine S-methyltransferase
MILETIELPSPLGSVTAAIADGELRALGFTDHWPRLQARLRERDPDLEFRSGQDHRDIGHRLTEYFRGDLGALTMVRVRARGTPFQERVWQALRRIPAGQTVSYGSLARSIGAPGAARAVGAACNANPVWLVIPCHRVVGANGKLTGYAGGIERKRWLLAHEQGTA